MRQQPARDEHGASAVEYGLLVSGIAAVIAIAVYAFGGAAGDMARDSCEQITTATGSAASTSCS